MLAKRKAIALAAAITLGPLTAAADVDLPIKGGDDYTSPTSVAGAETVSTKQAYDLWRDRVTFVDVRSNTDWDAGRIPGARHINNDPGGEVQNLSASRLSEIAAKDDPLVIYCNGVGCDRSSWGAALAATWGWSEVYYFREGYPAWETAGYPVE